MNFRTLPFSIRCPAHYITYSNDRPSWPPDNDAFEAEPATNHSMFPSMFFWPSLLTSFTRNTASPSCTF